MQQREKLTYTLVGAFFLSVFMAQLSGNDKFPYLVMSLIFLNLILFGINFVLFIKKPLEKQSQINMICSLFLILYIGVSIYLSLIGVVDPIIFLGFR